jgi:hypothetical protein
MITLQDLFDELAYGELANVKMGNSVAGTIVEGDYPRVVSAINAALRKIYQRVNLRQKTINLHQQSGVTRYFLRPDYTVAGGAYDSTHYWEVSVDDPFEDDLIKVIRIFDGAGKQVQLNDAAYPADIFTPEFDVIEIAEPDGSITNADGNTRTALDIFPVTYQAYYPTIVLTQSLDPLTYKLHIPDYILDALLIYATYKLFRKPIKRIKGETQPSDTLLLEFENAVRTIEKEKLAPEENYERDPFTENGWA